MKTLLWRVALALALGWAGQAAASDGAVRIENVRIVDGTGAPAREGAVRIAGGRIVAVGALAPEPGETVVDGGGRVLAPGFIDSHSHHDAGMFEARDLVAVTSQGVTTLVVGQDGFSQLPLAELFAKVEATPLAVNLASYSGHNTLRARAMGEDARRAATAQEIARMSALLEDDLRAGALGLSTGLMYEPGAFSTTEEVVALAQVAARHGGRYISHLRDEGFELLPAIDEAIEIGRRSGAPVQISHLKIAVRKHWGRAGEVLAKLDRAREVGVDITADVYPYTFWQSTMRVMFLNKHDEDREGLAFNFAESTRPEDLRFTIFRPDPSIEGKTIAQVAAERGQDPVEAYIALARTLAAYERAHAGDADRPRAEAVIGTSMDEADVESFLRWSHTNVGSDGFPTGHPRGHGSFTRVLGRYVRERGALTLEQAVHAMTGRAAAHLGFADRGVIAPGARADLVLFDPETVADRATVEDPTALSVGVDRVWVGGEEVFADGRALGRYPGEVVRRAGTAGE